MYVGSGEDWGDAAGELHRANRTSVTVYMIATNPHNRENPG